MLHITFSKYDCLIVHKAYYLFTCTCVSINSFHSHSHMAGEGGGVGGLTPSGVSSSSSSSSQLSTAWWSFTVSAAMLWFRLCLPSSM